MLDKKVLTALIDQGLSWVREQQARFLRSSRKLYPEEKKSLGGFFLPETLALARVAHVFQIEDPPFLSQWRAKGVVGLLDFRQMAGITFVDTIVVATRFRHSNANFISLLFHELVHVVQFRVLTPEVMITQYLQGWAENGFEYYRIPLEVQAYDLQREFESNAPPFSAEDRVRQTLSLKGVF